MFQVSSSRFLSVITGFAFFAFFALSTPAYANDDHVSLSIGYYDVLDEDEALDFRAEYRWSEPVFWRISPYAGIEITNEGTIWGGAGLYSDFFVSDHTYITPSFGAGLYTDGGSDLDLGYPLQFRTQIEAGYQFENYQRLSIGFSHTSNAGLDDNNPGTEVLSLYYHLPW